MQHTYSPIEYLSAKPCLNSLAPNYAIFIAAWLKNEHKACYLTLCLLVFNEMRNDGKFTIT
jgi:hypothetical protein